MLGVQNMPGMQSMSHLSRGLLAGLQNPHMPSLDTSVAFQHQHGADLHASQGGPMQPYGLLPQSGAFSFATRLPMVSC